MKSTTKAAAVYKMMQTISKGKQEQ